MKTNLSLVVFLLCAFIVFGLSAYCQKNKQKPLDSTLEANNEKWKVKLHKGLGIGKPEFGPYTTSNVEKADSPVFKQRTKTGSYNGISLASEGLVYWDFNKYETVEKAKTFTTSVTTETDTAQLLFSIYRISKEENLTVLGELLNGGPSGSELESKTILSGIMETSYDTILWRFLIEDTFYRKEITGYPIQIIRGYLKTENDSLYAEPIMVNIGSPGDKYFWQLQAGVFVNNSTGDHLAALRFGSAGDLSHPFLLWIRKDLQPAKQHVIASLLALVIIVNTY